MRVPLALFAVLCGVLLFAGGIASKDALKITTREERTQLTVTVTLFDVTPDYRWLSAYACSAAVYEHGTFCTGDFERESTQEVRLNQAQYLFPWRSMPRGTLQITAIAFDQDGKRLASGQKTLIRAQ